jgi:hypothetical protein
MQLDFIKQIWESLDQEHRTLQTQILQVLLSKMKNIVCKLESISKKRPGDRAAKSQVTEVKRWKYILIKECLDESIEDLTSWQKMFDPSWFLIMKVSSPYIDQEVSRNRLALSSFTSAYNIRDALKEQPLQQVSVFLPGDGLETARIREIPFASAKYMQRAGSDQWLVVDRIPCDPDIDVGSVRKNIRELARKLSSVDPLVFGVLQCHGVVQNGSNRPSSFDFIFKIPRELSNEPRCLRSYLSSSPNLTLTNRYELAKQIAKSISYIHTLGFVHKNVRPETVLGFQTNKIGSDLFFLVGFENIRTADGRTLRSGDSVWEKNLYRHPHRQGLNPEDIYTMQHDIYSLGVCLLEIGLWESFLFYGNDITAPLPAAALGVPLDGPELRQPELMKEHLIALAKRDLPKRMGERYKNTTVNCLTCLDQDNTDFGDQSEFEDQDGVLVGVKYIEKVNHSHSFHVELVLTIDLDTLEAERDIGMKLFKGVTQSWSLGLNCGFLVPLLAMMWPLYPNSIDLRF